ncbi:hypothetical protein LOK49_LG04G02349 [Camellia lanceoleosa]|uniref:Uncharacterized protein n=1 Tax=Camellia lanceoleosa TaxID=1840588 RepID=A0ACC0I3C7_9ERIC|nr:hypothetical protein LOK49_LG04G02349 [Camellia lanceoleosa]
MCVDIDFNLNAQEVADDSASGGSYIDVTKLNVVEIVETKIRDANEKGDDTLRWLELEDLHMDDAFLLSLDLPSKFLMNMIKVSNIMGIDPKPFDPKTYVEEDIFVADESGSKKRIRLDNNIVRWRIV